MYILTPYGEVPGTSKAWPCWEWLTVHSEAQRINLIWKLALPNFQSLHAAPKTKCKEEMQLVHTKLAETQKTFFSCHEDLLKQELPKSLQVCL